MVVLFEPDKIYVAHRFLQHKPTAQDLFLKAIKLDKKNNLSPFSF